MGSECHRVKGSQTIFLNIRGTIYELRIFVADGLKVSLLLGMAFIRDHKCQLAQMVVAPELTVGMCFINHVSISKDYIIPESEILPFVSSRSDLPSEVRDRLLYL